MLTTELERLMAHLRRLERSVVPLMRQGVDAEQVYAALGGADVPSPVAEWFGWHDGVEVRLGQLQDDVNVIPAYNPLSLSEAIQAASIYRGDPVLGADFIPLMTTAAGDIYAAVWGATEGEAVVAGVLIGEPTEIEFNSIEQMVSVFNACYDNGSFFVGTSGRLEMNPGRYEETYAEIVESA